MTNKLEELKATWDAALGEYEDAYDAWDAARAAYYAELNKQEKADD